MEIAMTEAGPRTVQRTDARTRHRLSLRVFIVLMVGAPWAQSTASDPTLESIRGGAGIPVVEVPGAREQNLKTDSLYEKYAEGLYVQELFNTVSADKSFQINVWNLLVGPGKKTNDFGLPGAAVLLVRAGSAQIVVGGVQGNDLEMGAALVVPEETPIRITNRDPESPVLTRATLFSGVE
jgi:hypothetical protein